MSVEHDNGQQISYASELARKGIHLASLGIPTIYLHIPHQTGIVLLMAMTAVSFAIDILRHYHEPSRRLLMVAFGKLLRDHEVQTGNLRLTGATWVLIAATATLGVFPTIVGVTAFTILIVSDTFAALIGRRFGVRRFLDKSVVGTLTFILTAIAVVVVYDLIYTLPLTYLIAGTIGSVIGGVVEAGSVTLKMDDNISIPFSIAITMMLCDWLFRSIDLVSFIYLLP